ETSLSYDGIFTFIFLVFHSTNSLGLVVNLTPKSFKKKGLREDLSLTEVPSNNFLDMLSRSRKAESIFLSTLGIDKILFIKSSKYIFISFQLNYRRYFIITGNTQIIDNVPFP